MLATEFKTSHTVTESDIPFLLTDTGVHRNAGEVALPQESVQLVCTKRALDEDDDLVELQAVQELVQLPVLLRLAELDVVLLKTVKRELRVIVDVNLQRIPHELLANRPDLLRQGGAEHHDLLVGRSGAEDLLDVASHIFDKCQHLCR